MNLVQECVGLKQSNSALLLANERLKARVRAAEGGHIREERVNLALLQRIDVLKTEIEMLREQLRQRA